MSNNVGYWYKNNKLFELSGENHINFIIHNPKMFNIDKAYIEDIYNKHNEIIGSEGEAREEIIKKIITTSRWIRIRHYIRPNDYWSIQCNSLKRQKRELKELIEFLILDKELMRTNDSVVFLGFGDNSREEYNFMTGGINKFLQENKPEKDRKSNIIILNSNSSFLESNLSAEEYLLLK